MRCLYEVLDVEQDADDAAIKLAYRKGALRWHPDKNQANLQEAEERFKELQNAYEVLSDKHERAWYDSHRADILRGGARHQAGGDSSFAQGQPPPEEPDLFPFFSSTCFSGYADGPTGFYGVYEGIFQQLAKQEAEAAQQAGGGGKQSRGPTAAEEPPLFGASAAAHPQVAAFYSHWLNFATCKDFAWADVYNLAAAPNRKVRRLMEADNLKARRAKRREFNETVRELAAFVRKRDKRVAAHQAQQAQLRLEKEEQERLRQERERKERAQRAREFEEAAWAQAEAAGLESGDEEAALGDVPQELYCAACDKSFRSEGALANHERSKKHLERVEVLRQLLEEEEAAAVGGSEPEAEPRSEPEQVSDGEAAAAAAGAGERRGKKNKKAKKRAARARAGGFAADEPAAAARSESDAEAPAHAPAPARAEPAAESDAASASEAGEDDMLDAMLGMRSARAARQAGAAERSDGSDAESGASAASAAEPPPAPPDAESGEESDATEGMAGLDLGRDGPPAQQQQPEEAVKKKGRSKKERRRQAAKAEARVRGQQATVEEPTATQCSVCAETFSSRTKLFAHIKEAGHAAFKA